MPAKYTVEVYEPRSADTVYWHCESDQPFMGMAEGDLLNIPEGEGAGPGTIFSITRVEHILWTSKNGPRHKICVYTERHKNTPDLRRPDR